MDFQEMYRKYRSRVVYQNNIEQLQIRTMKYENGRARGSLIFLWNGFVDYWSFFVHRGYQLLYKI